MRDNEFRARHVEKAVYAKVRAVEKRVIELQHQRADALPLHACRCAFRVARDRAAGNELQVLADLSFRLAIDRQTNTALADSED